MISGILAFIKTFRCLPLSAPFDTRAASQKAEVSFSLDQPRTVFLMLQFSVKPRSKQTPEDLARALGLGDPDPSGARKEMGAPCSLRVVLSESKGGVPVLTRRITRPVARPRVTAGGRSLDLIRFDVRPGTYKLSVESLQPVPQFEPFAARLYVGRAS